MSQKTFNAVIKLRRDNDYNYELVKDTFIPLKGEVCVVDDARYGVRAKVGNGVSTYAQLTFADTYTSDRVVEKGYLISGDFYFVNSASENNKIPRVDNKLYLEISSGAVYYYDGTEYTSIGVSFPSATSTTAGITKLYNELGTNTNGAITQGAVKTAIDSLVVNATADETLNLLGFNNVNS